MYGLVGSKFDPTKTGRNCTVWWDQNLIPPKLDGTGHTPVYDLVGSKFDPTKNGRHGPCSTKRGVDLARCSSFVRLTGAMSHLILRVSTSSTTWAGRRRSSSRRCLVDTGRMRTGGGGVLSNIRKQNCKGKTPTCYYISPLTRVRAAAVRASV